MAFTLENWCEPAAGVALGTAVSTSNTNGPNQFSTITTASGSTLIFDNTFIHTFRSVFKAVHASGTNKTCGFSWTRAGVANQYARFYVYLASYPAFSSGNPRLCSFTNGPGVRFKTTATGALGLYNTGGTLLASTTSPIPTGQWVRVELEVTSVSGTTGSAALRLFYGANLEGTTQSDGCSVTSSASLVGSSWTTTGTLNFGNTTTVTTTATHTFYFDDCAIDNTANPGAAIPQGLTDSGQGADSLGISVLNDLAESGQGTDALDTSADIPLTDSGTGTDSLDIQSTEAGTSIPLTDSGQGTDTLGVMPGLPESGTGADALAVVSSVPLADTGAGSEAFWPGTTLTESGAGTDSFSLSQPVPLADVGSGSEAFWPGTALAESGTGTDSLITSQVSAIPLSDSGQGASTLGIMPGLTESGTGSDALAVAFTITFAESGHGTDSLLVPDFADSGTGSDSLNITVTTAFTETGQGTDALAAISFLAETGSGSDSLSVTWIMPVALADSGQAITALSAMPGLTETGAGSDSLFIAVLTGFPGSVTIINMAMNSVSIRQAAGSVSVSQKSHTVSIVQRSHTVAVRNNS